MSGTTDDQPAGGTDPASVRGKSGNQLLPIVAGVFAIVLADWIVLFTIVHRHPVAPVPLTMQRARG
jgi:hypothetical protein